MPVYGNYLLAPPYSLVKNIDIKTFKELQKVFNYAKLTFTHHTDELFCKSIKINNNIDKPIIATYDVGNTMMAVPTYTEELEVLIKDANKQLKKYNKGKYNNYKFDITGNWTTGGIIIMKKN